MFGVKLQMFIDGINARAVNACTACVCVFCAVLVLSCGKAISDAQDYLPNNPPSITGITASNVDGSAVNASKILSFAVYNIAVTASDPDNQALSYTFRSSCGSFKNLSVTRDGCTVQFVTGSISGGTKVIVSVQAADSRGGTAGGSINIGTGKLGPSISVMAYKDHIKSVDDVTLSIRSNCGGIFQILTDPSGSYTENTPINNNADVMIYDGDVADELVTGPASTTAGGIAHLPSLSGRTAGNYNDTYPVWVVFRDSLKQTTAVKCPVTVDDIKPHVVSWSPASGSVNVSQTPTIAVVFNEDIDPATLPGALSVTSTDGNGTVGAPSYDAGTHTARYPVTGLALSAKPYTALIAHSVTDLAGNALDGTNGSITFSTWMNEPGSAQWATLPGSVSNSSYFNGVATDSAGNTYAVGYVYGNGSFNFGGNSSPINGLYTSSNAVIVKYDSSGVCQWAKTLVSAPSESSFNSVVVDGSGNIYVAGYVYSPPPQLMSFGFGNGKSITCKTSASNPVVVKYDGSGICQWAKTLTSCTSTSGACRISDVGVDADGVYAVGSVYSQDTFYFDSYGVTGVVSGYNNSLIVKLESETGICQWARTTSSASSASDFNKIAVGTSGVYTVGVILSTGMYNFGSGQISGPSSSSNSVIVKYNSSGVCQWAKTLSAAAGENKYTGVATDDDDNAYAVGFVKGSGSFDFGNSKIFNTSTLGNSGGINSSIVKYDSSGACQWAKTIAVASGNNWFYRIVQHSSGLYVIGDIIGNGTFGFDGLQVTGLSGGDNAVVFKYDLSGGCQWAKSLVSASNVCSFNGIAGDTSGGVYIAGYLMGTGSFNFGGITPIITGLDTGGTPFIVKYQQ